MIYDDLVPLREDTLAASSITIVPVVRTRSGSTIALNAIRVPTGIVVKTSTYDKLLNLFDTLSV